MLPSSQTLALAAGIHLKVSGDEGRQDADQDPGGTTHMTRRLLDLLSQDPDPELLE